LQCAIERHVCTTESQTHATEYHTLRCALPSRPACFASHRTLKAACEPAVVVQEGTIKQATTFVLCTNSLVNSALAFVASTLSAGHLSMSFSQSIPCCFVLLPSNGCCHFCCFPLCFLLLTGCLLSQLHQQNMVAEIPPKIGWIYAHQASGKKTTYSRRSGSF